VSDPDASWARFTHAKLGFALEHPRTWEVYPDVMGCAVVMLEPTTKSAFFRPNLNVTIHPGVSLADFAAEEEARARTALSDFETLGRMDIELGGLPAHRTDSTYRQGVMTVRTIQWHADAGGLIVTVSAAAVEEDYDRLSEVIERIATSLEGIASPQVEA